MSCVIFKFLKWMLSAGRDTINEILFYCKEENILLIEFLTRIFLIFLHFFILLL